MNSLVLPFLLASVFLLTAESYTISRQQQDNDKPQGDSDILDEPKYEPRFLAVFIQADDGTNATAVSNDVFVPHSSRLQHAVETANGRVLPKVEHILQNLNATQKVDQILEKYGENGSEDANKFRNIIARLENSTLSKDIIDKVKTMLNNIEAKNGFALLAGGL